MNPKISGVALNPFYNTTVKTITGSTALTILQKVFVPAGTYEAGDLLIVNMLIGKIGAAGAFTYYLYSSPNDPTGWSLFQSAGQRHQPRRAHVLFLQLRHGGCLLEAWLPDGQGPSR
jgi:hypothetical protein